MSATTPMTQRGRDDATKERVRVFVRVRPLRHGEGESTLRLDQASNQTRVWMSGEGSVIGASAANTLQFDYDGVMLSDVSQSAVYETVARPLVDAATSGRPACLMCYGQTGTGKTYTFGGGECLKSALSAQDSDRPDAPQQQQQQHHTSSNRKSSKAGGTSSSSNKAAVHGVVGRALRQVMEWASARSMRVCISYVQVYMELLQDLLDPAASLSLREHPEAGVYVEGACWKPITSAEAACRLVAEADARRATAFTKLNADSSRSHAVLLVSFRHTDEILRAEQQRLPPYVGGGGGGGFTARLAASTARAPLTADAEWATAAGRLFLVDLAGSENTKRSGVTGNTFDEARAINQSLTTLGRCIQTLAGSKKDARPPVRESKLTRLLSPCLGGATTSLVCCVSAAAADRFETLNTLEFGRNAMRVILRPQSQMAVDFKALTIQLQARLDERLQAVHELEAAVHARVHGEYKSRLEELERARRAAEAAKQKAELERDRRAEGDASLERAANEARSAELARAQLEKTSRASHDSRAAIIATADSLAEEVVRARRERDEAITQLEVLRAQFGGGAPRHLLGNGNAAALLPPPEGAAAMAAAAMAGLSFSAGKDASAVERECADAIAEIALYRSSLERRKVRTRAAAARAVPAGGSGLLPSGTDAGDAAQQQRRAAADRKALDALQGAVLGALGGMGELVASAVELCETQHPDLWQGSAEQLMLSDQIRQSQRLVHLLGRVKDDFGGGVEY